MNFISDNAYGAAPEILAALARVNDGTERGYGADKLSKRVTENSRRSSSARSPFFPLPPVRPRTR